MQLAWQSLDFLNTDLLVVYLTRLKRSNSQDFDDKTDEFKRNGLRATTGGRLGWSKEVKYVLLVVYRHYNYCLSRQQPRTVDTVTTNGECTEVEIYQIYLQNAVIIACLGKPVSG